MVHQRSFLCRPATAKQRNAGGREAQSRRRGWRMGGATFGRGQGRRRADGGGEAEAIAGEGERGWTSACMAGDW